MEPLKDMFNLKWFTNLAGEFGKADANFNVNKFIRDVMQDLETLSLNERMRKTSVVLHQHLPAFDKSVELMKQVIPSLSKNYTNLVFPDYVALYGTHDLAGSMEALKYFTRFGSSEFAVRVFLRNDFKNAIKIMQRWAFDNDPHVRRLSSEGSRPRLPWSFKLDEVIKNPSVTFPILDALKEDEHLYVRKSVANHLNDISKDNPGHMVSVLKNWNNENPHTTWIIKHASRSLIKQGYSDGLSVFNFEKHPKVRVENFSINKKIKLGQTIEFSFDLISEKKKDQKLVVDYIIYYRKSSGQSSPKVFKLKEVILQPLQKLRVSKKQVIKDFTTRVHFPGVHSVEIQVNGIKFKGGSFTLLDKKIK